MNARRRARTGRLLAAGIVALATLASCSGGASDTVSNGTAPNGTVTPAVPESSGPAAEVSPTLPGRLVIADAVAVDAVDVVPHTLSDVQVAMVNQLGPPDRFTIRLLTEQGVDGSEVPIRHETWYFDATGAAIVFRNGEVFTERRNGTPVEHPALGVSSLRPEQFVAGMSVDQLLAVTGQRGYYAVDEPGLDGELVALEGLIAGIDADGVVVFIQAIPIRAAESRSSG